MPVATISVNIEADAAARIAELGLEDELSWVLEFTKTSVPALHSIDVRTWVDYEEGTGLHIELLAWKDAPYVRRDPDCATWKIQILSHSSAQFREWITCELYPREAYWDGR